MGEELIQGGATLLNGLFGGLFGGSSQSSQMRWQEKMWDKQAQWNAEQAELNRQFNSEEAQKAREWNSIAQQMKRASAAGVNPWSLLQGGSVSNQSNAQAVGSQPLNPAFPQPADNPALARTQSFNAVALGLSQLATVGKSIAEAKKTGVETSQLEQMFSRVVKEADLKNQSLDIANGIQNIVLKYQNTISRRQADKLFEEIKYLGSSDMVNLETLRKFQSEVVDNLAKAEHSKALAEQIRKYTNEWMDKLYSAEVQLKSSHVALNQSSIDLNESLRHLNELSYDVRSANADEEKRAAAEQYIQAAEQAGVLTSLMKERLEQAIRDNDWAVVKNIFDLVEQGTRSFSNVVGAIKPYPQPAQPSSYVEHSVDSKGYERSTRRQYVNER